MSTLLMRSGRLILSLLLAARLAALPQQPLQLRVESRLVLVDLLATSADGSLVADLKPGEIELFEDGVKRMLTSFELVRLIGSKANRQPGSPGPLPPHTFAGNLDIPARGVTLALLLDLDGIAPTHLPLVKDTISSQLKSMGAGADRFMLATLRNGLQVQVPFSADIPAILKALAEVYASGGSDASLLRFGEDLENILVETESAMLQGVDIKKVFTNRSVRLAREYIMREDESIRAACAGSSALVAELASLPGRKNLVLFSSGRRLNFAVVARDLILRRMDEKWAQDTSKEMSELKLLVRTQVTGLGSGVRGNSLLGNLLDEANRARVSFYTVDARGLIAPDDARFRGFTNSQALTFREEINQPQAFLRDLASGTGGRWLLNRNDLTAGIEGAYQDAAEHYELAFIPDRQSRPGALHRITVRVLRPDVRVTHRQSYVEPEAFDPGKRAVENAFRFPGLFQDFPFEVDTTFQAGDLKVDVFVPTRSLRFSLEGERYRCRLEVHMALFDIGGSLYGGEVLFSKTYSLDFGRVRYQQIMRSDNLTASYRGKIKPASYRLRVVVRQTPSATTAALERRLAVP